MVVSTTTPTTLHIDQGDLGRILRKVSKTADHAKGDRRPHLRGLLLEVDKHTICFVASNGCEMVVAEHPITGQNKLRVTIPHSLVTDLVKTLKTKPEKCKGGEVTTIEVNGDNIKFITHAQTTLSGVVLDRPFPDWHQVLREEQFCGATIVDRLTLKTLVTNIVSNGRRKKTPWVKLSITKKPDAYCGEYVLTLSELVPIDGRSQELIIEYTGVDIEVGLSTQYLLNALTSAGTTNIMLEFVGPLDPVRITEMGGDSISWAIMPAQW